MLFDDNTKRALRGYIYSNTIYAKTMFVVLALILAIQIAGNYIVISIFSTMDFNSSNNGGTLITGLVTALVMLIAVSSQTATRKNLKTSFAFPMNREVYTVGNFISIIYFTFGALVIASIGQIAELLVGKVITSIFTNAVVINQLTLENYLSGFWVTFCYLIAVASLSYCIAAFFSRFKLQAVIPFLAVVGIMFIFGGGRTLLFKLMMFFIGEQSMVILSFKLCLVTIFLQLLSYIPLKSMEVNG